MGKYAVFRTPIFSDKISFFSDNYMKQVDKIEDQLEENPYVGRPLGTKWFREKRLNGWRVYYLIYEDLKAVYIITLSDKKDQQKTINTIKMFLEKFKKEIEDLIHEN